MWEIFDKGIFLESIKNAIEIILTDDMFKYIGLFFILGLIIKIFKPVIKGYIGEKVIDLILNKELKDCKILKDIMIKTNTGSSQIDHIVISKFGVFVLETKNYKGWIFGKEKNKKWTQNIYGKKYYFQNPLHQNYGHIKKLKEIEGLENINFISLILFSGEATLKNDIENVIYFSQVGNWISEYKEIIYEEEEVNFIYNKILENNIQEKKVRREHIKNIKNKKKNRK